MHRAVAHLPASHGRGAAIDSITLAHDERRLRRKERGQESERWS